MPLQAYSNYAMAPPQVGFFFRVELPTVFVYYMFGVCSGVCFLLSGAMLDAIFTLGDSTTGVCTIATPWSLPMAGIYATWCGHQPTPGMHRVAAPSTTLSRAKPYATQVCCSPAIPSIWWGIQLWGVWQNHLIAPAFSAW